MTAVAGVSGDSVWLAGVGPELRPFLGRWDGTAWQPVPKPARSTIDEINAVGAVGENEAWLAGRVYGEHGGLLFEHYICR
jgi:hypothetical protein